jgi:hypothetical protein
MADLGLDIAARAHPAYPCLSLARVLALVGGVLLTTAFFMPWFSSQGLLLSGQFLHQFLSNPGDLRRFLPGTSGSASEAQLLRALVDLFPACGAIAFLAALTGGLWRSWRRTTNVVLALAGAVPLVGWAIGITRLPPGASPEVGLWVIASASVAILIGLALDLRSD